MAPQAGVEPTTLRLTAGDGESRLYYSVLICTHKIREIDAARAMLFWVLGGIEVPVGYAQNPTQSSPQFAGILETFNLLKAVAVGRPHAPADSASDDPHLLWTRSRNRHFCR
jgi:hypothetical protein